MENLNEYIHNQKTLTELLQIRNNFSGLVIRETDSLQKVLEICHSHAELQQRLLSLMN